MTLGREALHSTKGLWISLLSTFLLPFYFLPPLPHRSTFPPPLLSSTFPLLPRPSPSSPFFFHILNLFSSTFIWMLYLIEKFDIGTFGFLDLLGLTLLMGL